MADTTSDRVKTPHAQPLQELIERLGTDAEGGLSTGEVDRRSTQFGPNELAERAGVGIGRLLWEQFSGALVLLLIAAAVISALMSDYVDAVAILAIVILNALLGFQQEYKAQTAIAALKRMTVPQVKVRREGHVRTVAATDLVPGDVVILEAGGVAPADGRLIEAANLRAEEAALTGESAPVEKDADAAAPADAPLAERHNMIFMGTTIVHGRGAAVITATGMDTQLGRIATMLQSVGGELTPLQKRLNHLGRVLAGVALAIVAVIFVLGILRNESPRLMFVTAVSLAVAAVPEGLPAVVTIALALGAQRMLRRNALIRRLPAVETLGSVTTICSDKTGTLTRNQMTAAVLEISGRHVALGEGEDQPTDHPGLLLLLAGGALCNDAVLETNDHGEAEVIGDPTEGALVAAAAQWGMNKQQLDREAPRVAEIPFEAARKRMTTMHELAEWKDAPPAWLAGVRSRWENPSDLRLSFTKGAVDSLLDVTSAVWTAEETVPLDDALRAKIVAAHDKLAEDGMRILGVAFRLDAPQSEPPVESLDPAAQEKDLTLIGLVGLIDPPRPEGARSVALCRTAGIRPVMITGDHPLTARHIAENLGMDVEAGVVTGQVIETMDDAQLDAVARSVSVFARVSPKHKLRLVQQLQRQGEIVAMTGDGVNDAPALKQADVGVAMGITGTDVSKEAADVVLRDDNFATIVAAVEEGRRIFDNVRKFIKYLLSANGGEIWVMLLAPLFGMPLPLLPLQILWINLVTDGPPALALGLEPAERGVMRRPPYRPGESVLSRGLGWDIVWIGLVTGISSLAMGALQYHRDPGDVDAMRTTVFATLTFSQLFLALAIRSNRDSIFHLGLWSNRAMLGAIVVTVVLQLAVIYTPFMQSVFSISPLSGWQLASCVGAGSIAFWCVELEKLVQRIWSRNA
jgi:Ca2+-transporting ATPase